MNGPSVRKRGAKSCPACNRKNGARSFVCAGCGHAFRVRSKRKRQPVTDWSALERGMRVRVLGASGPYYMGEDGARSYMSDKGVYTVIDTDVHGIHTRNESGSYTYLYMGPETQSDLCHNLYRAPHKLLLCGAEGARPG